MGRGRANGVILAGWVFLATLAPSVALALPNTVFVYNHLPGKNSDGLEGNALGFILQELGLLDANGKPDIPEASIIRDGGGNVIGYRSADGTKEAYNVSSGATTDDAWKRVADGGLLHIIKHGASQKNAAGVLEEGGGLRLDGGNLYDGFTNKSSPGAGTGAGYKGAGGVPRGPYGLTPRPGENITLNSNTCWSGKDPDGAGPKTPVTTSGGGVPGVGTSEGEAAKMSAQVKAWLSGGTPAERQAAWERVRTAARNDGYPPEPEGGGERGPTTDDDIMEYISDLDPDTRYDKLQEIIDPRKPPVVVLHLRYRKVNQTKSSEGFVGHSQNPRQVPPGGGSFTFLYHDDDSTEFAAATLAIPSGSIAWDAILHVTQQGELTGPAPSGMELASGAFKFEILNGNPVIAPVQVSFAVYGNPASVVLRRFDPVQAHWLPVQGAVSWSGPRATIFTQQLGLYAAFQPIVMPALRPWGLAALVLLVAASGALAWRRRIASASA